MAEEKQNSVLKKLISRHSTFIRKKKSNISDIPPQLKLIYRLCYYIFLLFHCLFIIVYCSAHIFHLLKINPSIIVLAINYFKTLVQRRLNGIWSFQSLFLRHGPDIINLLTNTCNLLNGIPAQTVFYRKEIPFVIFVLSIITSSCYIL